MIQGLSIKGERVHVVNKGIEVDVDGLEEKKGGGIIEIYPACPAPSTNQNQIKY